MAVSRPKVKATTQKSKIIEKKVVSSQKPVSQRGEPVVLKAKVKAEVVKTHAKETTLKLSVYDLKGKVAESMTLPKEVFGAEVNKNLVAQAVRVYLANQRRGTVKTKSRGEVKISTRKIYKQKGTGRARHGAASAPIFVGGGIAFGPRPRDYSLKISKKMKRLALFSALSAKLKEGEIKIVSGLEKIEPKTKSMTDVINNLELKDKKMRLLLILPKTGRDFENVVKAARNIKGVNITSSTLLNTYIVLDHTRLLFMKNAVENINSLAKGN
jgi:large subunit ribosomal protein L4